MGLDVIGILSMMLAILGVGATMGGLALRGIANLKSDLTNRTDKLSNQMESMQKELRGELNRKIVGLRDELKGDIAGLRDELKGDVVGLRDELKGDTAGLRDELKGHTAGLRDELKGELKGLRTDLRTEIRESERRLGSRIDGLSDRIAAVHSELVETRVAMSDRVGRLEGTVFGIPLPDTGTDPA